MGSERSSERTQERTLFVAGHKNPDTDAVCAAIAYADYKRRSGVAAKAFRAGNLNAQTRHVLARFGVEPPPLLADVFPRVGDIMLGRGDIIVLRPDQPLADAHRIMLARRFSFLPVADADDRCIGKVSLLTLVQLLTHLGRGCTEGAKRFDLSDFTSRTDSRLVNASDESSVDPGENAGGADSGAGVASDPEAADRHHEEHRWFEGLIRSSELCGDAESEASEAEASYPGSPRCVITDQWTLLNGEYPALGPDDLLVVYSAPAGLVSASGEELRAHFGKPPCALLLTPLNYIDLIVQLHLSMPVSEYLETPEPTFRHTDLIRDVERAVNRYNHGGFIVTDDEGTLRGVLTRILLARTSRYLVALVDHNEYSQAVDGIEQADVAEIVDHHRLGARTTDQPITFINRVVGSTCTIVADMFRSARLIPTAPIAGCMLSAILSDTVILRSPTTTELDREIARELAGLAGVDLEQWGEEMFAAGTDLHEIAPREIILQDQKQYEEAGWRFAVSQIEMVGFKSFNDKKSEIRAALTQVRAEQGVHFACLLVSDISKDTSLLVFEGSERIAAGIGYPAVEEGLFELKGVLSRKKQLLPHLLDVVRAA